MDNMKVLREGQHYRMVQVNEQQVGFANKSTGKLLKYKYRAEGVLSERHYNGFAVDRFYKLELSKDPEFKFDCIKHGKQTAMISKRGVVACAECVCNFNYAEVVPDDTHIQ